MVDRLEQAGMRDPNAVNDPADFVRVPGANNGPKPDASTGPAASSTAPGEILDNPNDNSDLEMQRKQMQASFTRRQQVMAAKQKEVDSELAKLQASNNQLTAMMAQQANAQQAPADPRSLYDELPENLKAQDSPEMRALLATIENRSHAQNKGFEERIGKLTEQNEQLTEAFTQQQAQMRASTLQQQAVAFGEEYKDYVSPEQAAAIAQQSAQSGMSPHAVMMDVAPEIVKNKMRNEAIEVAKKELQDSYGAGLGGMSDEFLTKPPTEAFVAGEDMIETARRTMGPAAFSAFMRESEG